MTPLQYAQLLQIIIPLLTNTYVTIRKDVQGQGGSLPPLEDLLKSADANYQSVIDKAQAELAKLKQKSGG